MTKSHDAAAILALPAARHPMLMRLCSALAAHPSMTIDRAKTVVDAAVNDLGLGLAVEMFQPENQCGVPFRATSIQSPQQSFQAGVDAYVTQILSNLR